MKKFNIYLQSALFFTILNLFTLFSAFAEPKIEVSGQVKDESSKENLEYCSVRIFSETDSLIVGAVTDSKGFFNFALVPGNYKLVIDFLGYKTMNQTITVKSGNEFLGIFGMQPDAVALDEVTVAGKTKEISLDKEEVLITETMRTGTSKTDEVLEKIKGVSYDRYNNSIKVDGNKNIVILVNGLEKDPNYIRNLSPDRLQKVEIIRDPGGRYALEGYSAIINVILKNDYQGSELYIDNMTFFNTAPAEKMQLIPINNFNGTFNYTYNKINLYAKAGSYQTKIPLPLSITKNYADETSLISKAEEGKENNLSINRWSTSYTLGCDYYLNPRHTISYEARFSNMPFGPNEIKTNHEVFRLSGNDTLEKYFTDSKKSTENLDFSNSLFYREKLSNKLNLGIDFSYSKFDEDYTNYYNENSSVISYETGNNKRDYTKLNVETDYSINNKMSLQFGYGNTWKNAENNFVNQAFQLPENSPTKVTQSDLRHQLYTYYSVNFSEKFVIKAGIAAEHSSPEINNLGRTYLIYMPHADIEFKPMEILDLIFKYRSSSIYPSIEQANPFTNIIDAGSVKKGNPNLDPAVVHKISFRAEVLQGLISIEPYYHFSENYITGTGFLRNDGIFEYGFDNSGNYEHKGIKGNFTIPFGKSIFLQTSLDFYKSKIEYAGNTNKIADWSGETNLVYINHKYKTVAGIVYQNNASKVISAQGWSTYDTDMWFAFVQQPFFKEQLNIMVGFMLPVDLGVEYSETTYTQTENYEEKQIADVSIIKKGVLLKISYRLQRGKDVKKTEKEIIQEQENQKKGFF